MIKRNHWMMLGSIIILLSTVNSNQVYPQRNDINDQKPDIDITKQKSFKSIELLGNEGSKSLYRVLLDNFEVPKQWKFKMARELGVGSIHQRQGTPLQLTKQDSTSDNSTNSTAQEYVLGVHVKFERRAHSKFFILLKNPIFIEGLTKEISLWTSGRQRNFTLSAIVNDLHGQEHYIKLGKLNYFGWKKLEANIPNSIIQSDFKKNQKQGLTLKGFVVDCSILDAIGDYYIYFDNLELEVSRFWEEYRDWKDPKDNW